MADAIDLGSIVNRRAGSSPVIRIFSGFEKPLKASPLGKLSAKLTDGAIVLKNRIKETEKWQEQI